MREKKHIFTALCLALLCFSAVGSASASWITIDIDPALLCPGGEGVSPAAELQTYKNSIGTEFVLIPAGSFMHDGSNEKGIASQRSVTISKPFYLGKYEVTQAEWVAVMGDNPSRYKERDTFPVEQVSWDDAQEFIRRLNKKEGHDRYRLPTEMEWEFAARGGTNTRYFFGDNECALEEYAWASGISGKTSPVGEKRPNQYGLYDIYGNIYEWCQDWYGDLPANEVKDYHGAVSGSRRVYRGGSWSNSEEVCRSGFRSGHTPDTRFDYMGFRLALSPE